MRTISRKALSIIMSVVLVVGLCPGLAYAGDGEAPLVSANTEDLGAGSAVGDGSGLAAQSLTVQGTASSYGYIWPLKYAGTISQQYGNNGHTGTDIAIGKGNDVVAMMDGTVKYVQKWDGKTKTGMQSYGNLVVVYHPKTGAATYYAHLNDISVSVGQSVSQYQTIGHVGTTGNSTGYHLHLELHLNAKSGQNTYGGSDGTRTNPLSYVSSSNIGPASGASGQYPGNKVTTVPEGTTFIIKAAGNKNFVLDVQDGAGYEGCNLQLYTRKGEEFQRFSFEKGRDGTYHIANWSGEYGVYVGLTADSYSDEANVGLRWTTDWDINSWYVETTPDGYYSFRNKYSNLYLDVAGGGYKDNVNLWQYHGNGTTAQKFILEAQMYPGNTLADASDLEGTFLIESAGKDGLVWGVEGGYGKEGANLQVQDRASTTAQEFTFNKQDDGTYTIANWSGTPGVLVGLTADSYLDCGNVGLRHYVEGWEVNRWYVEKTPDGCYSFRNKFSSLYADVDGGAFDNKRNIWQYRGNGSTAQKFKLVPVAKEPEPKDDPAASSQPAQPGQQQSAGSVDNPSPSGGAGSAQVPADPANSSQEPTSQEPASQEPVVEEQPMHRLYNPWTGEHFYTADGVECDDVVEAGWRYEGAGWLAPAQSGEPVYRLYNPYAGEHHYTMDASERDALVSVGWVDEGVGWLSDAGQGTPLYRDYNPNAFANNHNYTADPAEHDALMEAGWKDEGLAWFGVEAPVDLADYSLYRITADDFQFDVPEYWRGHVSVFRETNKEGYPSVTLCLKGRGEKDSTGNNYVYRLATVSRQPNTQGYTDNAGDVGSHRVHYHIEDGKYVSVWTTSWPFMAWYDANSADGEGQVSTDDYRMLVDLSTGGSVGYEEAISSQDYVASEYTFTSGAFAESLRIR